MANIILYFGSFNPVHNGHTAVAGYVLERRLCDELWLVVSPSNPLKINTELASGEDRLRMAEIAVAEQLHSGNARVCDVEFHLPTPSYTIDTLRYLSGKFPTHTFSILMGADIMAEFNRWKEYKEILNNYKVYIYPRGGYALGDYEGKVTFLGDAPMWDYSSTDIRKALEEGRSVENLVSPGVLKYIEEHELWRADYQHVLERLDERIAIKPTAALYIERGRLHNANGQMHKALNDFLKAQELEPGNAEARSLITMIREIFAFRYVDYYNP